MTINSKIIKANPLGYTTGIFYLKPLVLLGFILLLANFKLNAQARLEVINPKINYGSVMRGETIKNVFEIKNTGNEPLIISEAEIACSCTSVDYSKQPVLPSQSTTIVVNFNTTIVWGRQDRVVLIHSNDPKSPAKLRYKGNVVEKK